MAQLGAGMAGRERIRYYPEILSMERRTTRSTEGDEESSSGSKNGPHEWSLWCYDWVVFEILWC